MKRRNLAGFLLFVGLLDVCGPTGCSAAGQANAVATIPADVAFAVCVISTYASDEKSGATAMQIAADELAKCGGTAANIATILDAHEAAEVVEGRMTAGDAGKVGFALRAKP